MSYLNINGFCKLHGEIAMSNKIIISALGAIVAIGLGSQALADDTMQSKTKTMLNKEMPAGFEKCYGIAKTAKNDCASGTEACAGQSKTDGAKDAWLGVPKGTCDRIVGGSTNPGTAS
jgi:uncharacterized membrane protein